MSDWMTELEDELKNKPTEAPAAVEPGPTEEPAPVEPEPTEAPAEAEPEATEAQPAEEAPAPVTTEEEPAPQQRAPMIPKSRLDEEIEKRRKLEEELKLARSFVEQTMQQRQAPQQPQEPQSSPDDILNALYKREYDALLDGDTAAAMQFRRQADGLRTEMIRQQTLYEAQNVVHGNFEQTAFNQRLTQVVEQYPVFLETSDDYDPQLAQMALTMGNAFKAQGMNSVAALEKTLETLKPILDARYTPPAQTPASAPAPIKNVAAKVAASRAQPPATQSAGSTQRAAAKLDVMSMTVEDFEKLPQDEINKLLRGG